MKILILSIADPILIGVYSKENLLLETYKQTGNMSDNLPKIFNLISRKYSIKELFYINSPGSFMGIKTAYIFLKTVSVVKNIPFYATHGFHFNNNNPIQAIGNKVFIQSKDGKIKIEDKNTTQAKSAFCLPRTLKQNIFSCDTMPQYCIPAV